MNAVLRDAVEAELEWEPRVDSSQIGVAVRDGVITLSGTVSSYPEKVAALEAAKRVHGAEAVADEVEVTIAGGRIRTDSHIAEEAVQALERDVIVPHEQITVTIRNGIVTLEGEVDWRYQKDAAEEDVGYLRGVTNIINLVTVQAASVAEDVKERIEAALRRHAELDARRIMVERTDGTVTLRGSVRSFAERQRAEDAAWAAPGIIEVRNELRVVT